jgi:hypothetical protein
VQTLQIEVLQEVEVLRSRLQQRLCPGCSDLLRTGSGLRRPGCPDLRCPCWLQ